MIITMRVRHLSRSAKHLEVINIIKHSQNYHERRESMGALAISLFWSSPKIKETKNKSLLKNRIETQNSHFIMLKMIKILNNIYKLQCD